MSLLEARNTYKPFQYPWAYDFWKRQQQIHWMPEEVPLGEDCRDWAQKITENERNLPDGPTVVNGIDVIKNFRPWAVFGLDPKKATASDVRSRFRKLIMQHHPDKGGDPRVAERLKKMRDSMLAFMPDDRKAAGRRDGADPVTTGLVMSLRASRRALQRRWSPARADGYREVLVRLNALGG
jgi:hypothetical protein